MTIGFNGIPNDQLVPFAYVEFNNQRAVQGPGVQPYKTLLVGPRLSTGSVAENIPKLVTNPDQVADYAGRGSVLHNMAIAYFKNNQQTETYMVGQDDTGNAASGDFTFSGTATKPGTVHCYIGGNRVSVDVQSGDTASEVATALKAALALPANENIPVNYGGSAGVVDIALKNAGDFGNFFNLRVNHLPGEEMPAGLSVAVTQPTSGSGAPDIQDVIDAIGDEQYNVIVHPYIDSANLTALESELDDRWGPLTQNDGVAIGFNADTYANLHTFAASRNSAHHVFAGAYGIPTAPWQVAAAIAAVVAFHGQIDPARPFQTLGLKGVLAPASEDRFTRAERNLLLKAGIATLNSDNTGSVRIERLVMGYTENEFGAADTSYRDLNTILTLSYLRWDWRNYILRKYPRHKLASDGARVGAGQPLVTPTVMKAEAVLKFTEWENLGLVEGLDQFKNDLVCEVNVSDPNRLDLLMAPNLVNQLRVSGTQIQFLL